MWLQKVATGAVEWLAFSPDGRTLFTDDASGTVTAWDTKSRKGRPLFRLSGGPVRAAGLFAAGGGKYLVVRGNPPVVWDLKADAEYARLQMPWPSPVDLRPLPTDDSVLLYVPDSRRAVVTWDVRTKKPGPVHDGWVRTAPLKSFDVAPDGRTAALLDALGLVVLFDLGGRRELTRFDGPYGTDRVRFSADGTTLVLFSGKQVCLWDVRTRSELVEEIRIHPQYAAVTFHPHTRAFAALSPDRLLTLFSLDTGQPLRVFDAALGRNAHSAAFAPDGLRCAVGGSNKLFAVFDLAPPGSRG